MANRSNSARAVAFSKAKRDKRKRKLSPQPQNNLQKLNTVNFQRIKRFQIRTEWPVFIDRISSR